MGQGHLKVLRGRKGTITGRCQLEHWREIKSFFISTQEMINSFFLSLCLGTPQSGGSKTGRAHPKEGSLGALKAMTLWGRECAVLG